MCMGIGEFRGPFMLLRRGNSPSARRKIFSGQNSRRIEALSSFQVRAQSDTISDPRQNTRRSLRMANSPMTGSRYPAPVKPIS